MRVMKEVRGVGHLYQSALRIIPGSTPAEIGDHFQVAIEHRDVARCVAVLRPVVAEVVHEEMIPVKNHVPRIAAGKQLGVQPGSVQLESFHLLLVAEGENHHGIPGFGEVDGTTMGAPVFELRFALSEVSSKGRLPFALRAISMDVVFSVAIDHEKFATGQVQRLGRLELRRMFVEGGLHGTGDCHEDLPIERGLVDLSTSAMVGDEEYFAFLFLHHRESMRRDGEVTPGIEHHALRTQGDQAMFLAGVQQQDASAGILGDGIAVPQFVIRRVLRRPPRHQAIAKVTLADHHRFPGRRVVPGGGVFLMSCKAGNGGPEQENDT